METIVLNDAISGSTARISAHIGFNCYAFQAVLNGQTIDVIDACDNFATGQERPSGHGIPILFPFPNRIRRGTFHWDGRDYELPASHVPFDGTGNAIHGFCLDRPWRVTSSSENAVTGQFQLSLDAPDRREFWPADFLIEIRYELRGPSLRADILISNPCESPLPWGFGTHPYFRLPLSAGSHPQHCLVVAPAAEEWELTDCLPTGSRRPVPTKKDLREGAYFDGLKLDDVLTRLCTENDLLECLIFDEQAGLQISERYPPHFRELVVYTPPGRDCVCLEPYTCVTDAINLEQQGVDAGWNVLLPGKEFRTWIEITAGPILA